MLELETSTLLEDNSTLLEEATELDETLTLLLDTGAGFVATLLELGTAWTAALD